MKNKCGHAELLYHYTETNTTAQRDVYRCQKCKECFRIIPTRDERPTLEAKTEK